MNVCRLGKVVNTRSTEKVELCRAHELQGCPNDAPNDISPQLIDYKSKLHGLPECGDSFQWWEQEVVTASFTASRSTSIALN
jgi:hypothetical protein